MGELAVCGGLGAGLGLLCVAVIGAGARHKVNGQARLFLLGMGSKDSVLEEENRVLKVTGESGYRRGQKVSGRRCRSKRMGRAGHDVFRKSHVFKF